MSDSASSSFSPDNCVETLSKRLSLPGSQVRGAVSLLSEGNTIPFIARYRKEKTGGLHEGNLRDIEDGLASLKELAERKATILKTIGEQGKLDAGLEAKIASIEDRKELEELYLPYKPKRRTRATMAKERGLGPLADYLRAQENRHRTREEVVAPFIDPEKDVPDMEAALKGAGDILAEEWAEDALLRGWIRSHLKRGRIFSKVKKDWKEKSSKFETYYEYSEALEEMPTHRFLAIRRGEAESVLMMGIEIDEEDVVGGLVQRLASNRQFLFHKDLSRAVSDCFGRLLFPSLQNEVLTELKEKADEEAIAVFATNLKELLLAAPAGPKVVMGVDPGFRTGAKVAVVDATGKFVVNTTIYPTDPHRKVKEATAILLELIDAHGVELIAIGNGTASRETDVFVAQVIQKASRRVAKVMVNESGASIYSASDVAREEFPDLDLTVRGAISIARRLQDPLAELVKIDPKSIGVGQYQHDVNQTRLRKALDREVESCVNSVGVDLNMASAQLLSYVAGVGPKLAKAIVKHRDACGRFDHRRGLLDVERLGAKAFEQCAGFLRIRGGSQPLDDSAVHPEAYGIVQRMAKEAGVETGSLVANGQVIGRLDAQRFVDDKFGLPTIEDILEGLEKAGRDPRDEFRVVQYTDGVNEVGDLREGMTLEGVVTNVTHFGAFVDIGVHQDGLVHISELDNRFVENASDIVAVGDILKVMVLEVDVPRGRIGLSRKRLLKR